jgi:tRNA G18 (ribose-2'-O)-methylase SpoU
VPIYRAPQPILETIVGFPMHRGVLATATRAAETNVSTLLGGPLVVGICGVTNHDNVGGIFRNAAAFGASAVVIDRASCDPLYRKSVRVSVGGALVVPFGWVADEAAMIDALTARGYTIVALSPRGTVEIGRAPAPSGRVALLLGAEGPGLAEATLRRCTTARIAMQPGWDSLNVAAASAIALHWLRSERAT